MPLYAETGLEVTSVYAYSVQIDLVAELLTEAPLAGWGLEEKLVSETLLYVAGTSLTCSLAPNKYPNLSSLLSTSVLCYEYI